YLLGEPDPVLVVNEGGTIIAKTSNVGVHADSALNPALNVGDTIGAGHTIVVDPMLYDQKPKALFEANHVDGNDSHIDQTGGIFYMQETWDSVTVLNEADRPMQLLGPVSIDTLNENLAVNPEAVISISVDQGAQNSPSDFQFSVKHIFPET